MLSGLSTVIMTMFLKIYTDSGHGNDVTIYRPQCPSGFCFLGDYAQGTDDSQPNYGVTLCVKKTKENELFAHPVGFDKVWDSVTPSRTGESDADYDDCDVGLGSGQGSGSSGERDRMPNITFWKPRVPNHNYVPLGYVVTTDDNPLPANKSVCVVRKSIAVPAKPGKRIWSARNINLWPTAPSYEYLDLGTFFSHDGPYVTEHTGMWSLTPQVVPPTNSRLLTKRLSPEDMALLYQDYGSEAYEDISIYIPQSPRGYAPLGQYAERGYKKSVTARVVAVKEKGAERGLLATPIKYRQIWNSTNTGSHTHTAFWRPIPPPGYHCMGDLATVGFNPPPTNSMACLHWSTTKEGRRGWRIWWNRCSPWKHSSVMEKDITIWRVGYDRDCQSPNTFIAFPGFNSPSSSYMYFHCLPRDSVNV